MALKFDKTHAGRYYAIGETHTYLAVRDSTGWTLLIRRAETLAGLKISGDQVGETWHDTLSLAKCVAATFEQLGDDYRPADHGYRSRHTEAIISAHQNEAA